MNRVVLTGNLARDNELKESNSGVKYVFNALAVNKPSKDKDKSTIFINFTAFNKTAELLAQYTGKGSKIAIEGHLDVNAKEVEGLKMNVISVIADSIEFLSSAKKKEESSEPDNIDDGLPFV